MTMNTKTAGKTILVLALIVGVAAFLRFYRLTTVPPSLSHDETAIAYNAYSVVKTGKDEYGTPFPLLFRSFDDYKLPGMVYSTLPFTAIFGRSELAARLPSAIYGTLAILVMAGLAYELTGSLGAALLASAALAIQPWHVNFSRQLFESNGATFFFLLGTYFLVRSKKRYGEILLAGLGYVVALYFYYSVRLVIPFVLLSYLLLQWHTIRKHWKTTLLSLAVCTAVFFPMGKEMLSPGGWERINTVSVVNDKNFIARKEAYTNIIAAHPTILYKIIYNRRVALIETVLENYGKNISPHNLFVSGTGTYGALFPFDALLVILGIMFLFRLPRLSRWIIGIWLVSGFFPGALSTNQPNTLRTLVVAPAFAMLSGFGMAYIRMRTRAWRYGTVSLAVFSAIVLAAVFPRFLSAYFIDNPTHNAVAFADGNKQMIEYVAAHRNQYDRIYISGYYWRPYIFLLYWGGADPSAYQKSGNRERFGPYVFTSASWDTNGIKLMDTHTDIRALPHTDRTLFILAYPEYLVHQKDVRKITAISGRIADTVFVAASLTEQQTDTPYAD